MSINDSTSPARRYTIYFFQEDQDGPIKIGRTEGTPEIRRNILQCGSSHEIRILGTIPNVLGSKEGQLHRRFAHLHIRGEWFRPEPDLIDFIARKARPWVELPEVVRVRQSCRPSQAGPRPVLTAEETDRKREEWIIELYNSGRSVDWLATIFRTSKSEIVGILQGQG